MSTRATILIKEKDHKDICIYHHYDGYPAGVGKDLKHYLNSLKRRWYAYAIANALIKGQAIKDDDEYELTSSQHGDEDFAYLIDCDNRVIKCYKVGWDEFDWKESNLVDIPD